MANQQNTAMVVANKNTLKDLLERVKQSIADIIPKHITPERVMKMALIAHSKTPKLFSCTQDSFLKAMMTAAECGLDFSGTTGQGYLIPFRNNKTNVTECQFIAGYRGLMDMARRSGKVTRLEARVVYANDKFVFSYGINQRIEHQPCMDGNRGDIVCVYAIAQLSDGSIQSEVMTIEDVNAIRARSRAKDNGPWVTDYSEMARKTVLRRLCKYIPSSPELELVIAADPEVDVIDGTGFITEPDDGRSKSEHLADRLTAEEQKPEVTKEEPKPGPEQADDIEQGQPAENAECPL